MIKYIKTFFYPPVITYSYNQPKELVISKITEVLKRKVSLFDSNDMKGRFLNHETFKINTVPFTYTNGAVKYGSPLVGQILDSQMGITKIKTKAKPSLVLYFLFIVTIVFGLGFLYKFIQTSSAGFLFWSLVMLIVGPALLIGFSNVAIYSVRERFKIYIDKELRT